METIEIFDRAESALRTRKEKMQIDIEYLKNEIALVDIGLADLHRLRKEFEASNAQS